MAAGTVHLCTDQAGHHEVVAAAPTARLIGRTEEKSSGYPVGDLVLRGTFGLGYFLIFSIGNYTEDQWEEEKGIPEGYHPVWRKQGRLDFFVILLCLAVSDRMPTWSYKQIDNS